MVSVLTAALIAFMLAVFNFLNVLLFLYTVIGYLMLDTEMTDEHRLRFDRIGDACLLNPFKSNCCLSVCVVVVDELNEYKSDSWDVARELFIDNDGEYDDDMEFFV